MQNRNVWKAFGILILIFWGYSAFAGGPWVPDKKRGLLVAGVTPIIYSNISGLDSTLNLNRRVSEVQVNFYGEVGLMKNLALYGTVPIKSTFTGDDTLSGGSFMDTLPSGNVFGLGNMEVGLKYMFYNKKFTAAVSFHTEMNVASADTSAGLRTGYDCWGMVPGIHLGKGFTERFYTQLEFWYAFRNNNYSDEWRLNWEIGFRTKGTVWMALLLQVKESVQNGDRVNRPEDIQTGLYLNNEEYVAYSLKFAWDVSKKFSLLWSFGGGAVTTFIARTPSISVGGLFNL